jgi:hypothetical protein
MGRKLLMDEQKNEHPKKEDAGNSAPNPKGTDQATKDNDLTSGHSRPGDGGDDNAKGK